MSSPEEKAKRARRRGQKHKKRNKAKKIGRYGFGIKEENIEEWASYNYDHLQSCSCPMCGNKRNSVWSKGDEKLTIQERSDNEKINEEIKNEWKYI